MFCLAVGTNIVKHNIILLLLWKQNHFPLSLMDKADFNKLLGDHIRKVRLSKGMSQVDLASLMGINYQNISSYERGEIAPTLFWIHRLCESLGIETEKFVADFYSSSGFTLKPE